jgi:RNA polymerase sigma-70 factor (ECF subfamily)
MKGGELVLVADAFEKYQDAMQRSVARFCGDDTAAMDAVSQAFARAWMRREQLEAMPEPAMKAWLYATARNAAIDQKRLERRFSPLQDDIPSEKSENPTDRVVAEELLRALPESLFIPVHMKYYQGMNATEIGAAMGIPPATVRTRIRTALGMMRRNVKTE